MIFTYLIQDGDSNWFKIGKGNPFARRGSLQTGNPEELSFVAIFPDNFEAFLHEVFKDRRGRGEWFEFPDRLTAGILALEAAEKYRELRAKNPSLRQEMLAVLAERLATAI